MNVATTTSPSPSQGEGQGEGFSHPRNLKLISSARYLRQSQTEPEQKLWYYLRARRLENLKFRRQYPLGRYIVDFICVEKRIIIELDGGQHQENVAYDQKRDSWLRSEGYEVLRFWNNELIENLSGVLEVIRMRAVANPHPSPLPHREREEGKT